MFNKHKRRKQKRTDRKTKRHDRQAHRKEKRIEGREARQDKRIEGREQKRNQRLEARQKRQLERKWNKLSPEEESAVAETLPYQEEMKADLKAREIPIEDANDPIEVATKFTQVNEDIGNPIDEQDYDNAFINTEADFESNFEYLQKRERGQQAVKIGLGAVSGAINTYFGQLDEKQRKGEPLSEGEKNLLTAKDEAEKQGMKDVLGKYVLPLLVVSIIAYLIFKK